MSNSCITAHDFTWGFMLSVIKTLNKGSSKETNSCFTQEQQDMMSSMLQLIVAKQMELLLSYLRMITSNAKF